jgi:hypothetical protein
MKNTLFFFIIVSTFLFTTCKKDSKCPDPVRQNYYIQQWQKDSFPYTGNEELRFVRNSKDTISFYGSGIQSGSYEDYKLGGECYTNVDVNEQQWVEFTSADTKHKIKIVLTIIDGVTNMGATFDADFNILYNRIFAPPYAYDSLTIQKRTYHNISKLDYEDGHSYMLFTAKEGVIKVDAAGIIWEKVD